MKRTALLMLGLTVLVLSAPPASAGISVRFSFGAGILDAGDLRSAIQGYNDFSGVLYGSALKGGFESPKLWLDPSAEVLFALGPRWSIGLGCGYAFASGRGAMSYAVSDVSVKEELLSRIAAVPVLLNLHFAVPVSERLSLDAWAGPGLTLTRLTWDYTMTVTAQGMDGADHFLYKAVRPAFGGQAGLALCYKLSGTLDVFAEIAGRLAAAQGFSGDWTESGTGDFWAIDDAGTASIWAYDWMYDSKPYRQLSFQETQPTGASVKNPAEAKIGLSGVSLKLGIRIRPFGR